MRKRKDRDHFNKYVEEWEKETCLLSSLSASKECISYRKIVRMGARAIPLIMERMERDGLESNHWFLPLHDITNGEVKIPQRYRGRIKKMNRLWLEWYRKKQYIH